MSDQFHRYRIFESPYFVVAVQALSAAGAVAFLVSILVNAWVFYRWGLNFLQLASPADVINSGLQLFLVASVPLLAGAVGILVQKFVLPQSVQPMFFKWLRRVYGFLLTVLLGVYFLFDVQRWIDETITRWLIFYSVLFFVGGTVVGRVFLSPGVQDSATISERESRKWSWLAPVLLGCFVIGVPVNQSVSAVIAQGYVGDFTFDVPGAHCTPARVMWLGDRAIVGRCENGNFVVLNAPDRVVMNKAAL
ncbi:MAG: hypothetical protein WCZ66_03285 [Sphingomonadaceae bacterium]